MPQQEPEKKSAPAAQPIDMPDDEVLYELADLFRVFGDSTRISSGGSKTANWCGSAGRAKLFTTHWTMTMCAASSPWGWIILKNEKGWYLR